CFGGSGGARLCLPHAFFSGCDRQPDNVERAVVRLQVVGDCGCVQRWSLVPLRHCLWCTSPKTAGTCLYRRSRDYATLVLAGSYRPVAMAHGGYCSGALSGFTTALFVCAELSSGRAGCPTGHDLTSRGGCSSFGASLGAD